MWGSICTIVCPQVRAGAVPGVGGGPPGYHRGVSTIAVPSVCLGLWLSEDGTRAMRITATADAVEVSVWRRGDPAALHLDRRPAEWRPPKPEAASSRYARERLGYLQVEVDEPGLGSTYDLMVATHNADPSTFGGFKWRPIAADTSRDEVRIFPEGGASYYEAVLGYHDDFVEAIRDADAWMQPLSTWCPAAIPDVLPATSVALRGALEAGEHATVLATLSDLPWLEARCVASLSALLDDLAWVLRGAPRPLPPDVHLDHPPGTRLERGALQLLEAALQAGAEQLRRRPGRLFEVVYNTLFWHDALERAAHRDDTRDESTSPREDGSTATGPVWRWMEHWRATFEGRPGAAWLRRLRPPGEAPRVGPGAADLTAGRWRDDAWPPDRDYSRLQFSPSGRTLVVRHRDGLGFWDVARGVLRRFVGARLVTFFAGGGRVLGRRGGALVALDAEDAAELWDVPVPRVALEIVEVVDAEGLILRDDRDGTLVALGQDDGRERYRLHGVNLVLLSGDVFLARGATGEFGLHEVATGAMRSALPMPSGASHFALSPDRRWLAAWTDNVLVWDLTAGTVRHTIDPGWNISGLAFRADGALVISIRVIPQSGNTDSCSESVYDLATGACIESRSWDESSYAIDDTPREVAQGIVQDGPVLRVGGVDLPLPAGSLARGTPGGVFVASTSSGRLELYQLCRAPL